MLTDELWHRLAPLLPARPRRFRCPGRRPVDDRVALAGILFVLRTGVAWRDLPTTFGCPGVTCWQRLRDWQAAGVWQQLHERLLAELHAGAGSTCWQRRCGGRGSAVGRFPVACDHTGGYGGGRVQPRAG